MPAHRFPSTGRTWILRLAIATGLSLSAVCLFTAALGVAFWAFDHHRLPSYVSVVQSLAIGHSAHAPSAITLFWTMDQTGTTGRQLHLAIHSVGTPSSSRLLGGADFKPNAIAAAPDKDHLLVGTWDGHIHWFDLRHPEAEPLCIGHQFDGAVSALSLADDGQTIVSQSAYGLHAWDLTKRAERWYRDDLGAYCHVLLPGSRSAIVGTLDNRLLEIELTTGRTRHTLAHYASPILGATLSADGQMLALLRADSTLIVFDTHTATACWERRIHRADHTAPGRMAAFSPCGTLLVTSGDSEANSLAIWNVATGQLIRELHGHRNVVQGASFDSSEELRSWAADGTVRIWDVPTGAIQHINQLSPPNA